MLLRTLDLRLENKVFTTSPLTHTTTVYIQWRNTTFSAKSYIINFCENILGVWHISDINGLPNFCHGGTEARKKSLNRQKIVKIF